MASKGSRGQIMPQGKEASTGHLVLGWKVDDPASEQFSWTVTSLLKSGVRDYTALREFRSHNVCAI